MDNGRLFRYCKKGSGINKNRHYCATKVNKKKQYFGTSWGWCNDNCPDSSTALQDLDNGNILERFMTLTSFT